MYTSYEICIIKLINDDLLPTNRKRVVLMSINVPKAVHMVLKDYPDGLSAKQITDKIIARKLYSFSAKDPVGIVTRAIVRHCIGIDRSYSCADKYFTVSKNGVGLQIYKLAANVPDISSGIAETFVYPSDQIASINNPEALKIGMKTKIMDAKNRTVRDLLSQFCFFVPDYQRSYSWKNANIDEFLDDIFNIIHSTSEDARHFLGAITLANHKGRQDAVDLIDGQQRITTIFIFLYVVLGQFVSERFRGVDKASKRAGELRRKLGYLNDDGDLIDSRLILGEFNQEFFKEFVINSYEASDDKREKIKKKYADRAEFAQNQAIFDAYNRIKLSIEERLDCCQSEENAYEYLKALHICVLDRIEIVTMIVEEEADAFLIFETLNDRGLVLSAIDLIKNKLFQVASRSNEFQQIKMDWEDMCDNIENKDDLEKYILHYWRAFKGYITPQSLYKTCRDYFNVSGFEEAKKVVHELKEYSIYYNALCNPGNTYPWSDLELKNILADMKKMRYDLTHPILLAGLRKYPYDEVALREIARLCLNFLIRYISIIKNKPTSIEKDISKWACDPNFSIEMLKTNFTNKAPDTQFREGLLTLSLPYTLPLTHYLLCVYEADGFNRKEIWTTPGRGNNTVEHILPQTIKVSTKWGEYWVDQFGSLEHCATYKERMGNYAFLTRRAQSMALNKDFTAKKIIYQNETDMKLTQELTQYECWTPETIKERQEKMTDVWVVSISF